MTTDCEPCPMAKTCAQRGLKKRPDDCLQAEIDRIQTTGKAAAVGAHEPPKLTRRLKSTKPTEEAPCD